MKTLKMTMAFIMTACMLLSFAACGRGKPTAAPEVGTYAFDHAVILDDTWNPENFADIYGVEPKAAFNEDGTAEVVAHMTLTGTWKKGEFIYEDLFGEKRTATYVLDSDALTIKFPDEWEDGVYKTFVYIRSGTHSGNGDSMSSTENSMVGYYTLFSMESDGEVHDAASLKEVGMDNSYVELLADGTGTLQLSGEEPDTLAWKGEEIYIDGEKLSYVRDGYTLTFDFDGIVMTFSRNGGDAASTDNAAADSLAEAFGMGSETNQQTTLTGSWYGWIRESECWGGHKEDFRAAWGYINYAADSGNRKYFDVYKDGDSETPVISMWIDDDATDQYIIPIIGEEDAWVFDTYLETDEAPYFDTFVSYDGVLSITYAYTRYDGNSGCLVELFLRKDGAQWDEENDTLPPRYEEYKAALSDDKPDVSQPEPLPEGEIQRLPVAELAEIYMKLKNMDTARYKLTYDEVIGDYFNGVEGELYNSGDDWASYIWYSAENEIMLVQVGFKDEDGDGVYLCSGNMSAVNMQDYIN